MKVESFLVVGFGTDAEDSLDGGGTGIGVGFGEDTGSMKTNGGTGVVAGSSVIV